MKGGKWVKVGTEGDGSRGVKVMSKGDALYVEGKRIFFYILYKTFCDEEEGGTIF